MRPTRLLVPLFAALGLLLALASGASASSPSGVLITQLRLRTSSSPFDQYVQITNTTSSTVDLSGWQLDDCFVSGGTSRVGADGNPLPAGTTLPADTSFVFGKNDGDYTGTSDATYNFAVRENGGFELLDSGGTVQDSVGAPGTACAQGTGLTFPTTGSDFTFARQMTGGVYSQTRDNATDFGSPSGQADGTPCGVACEPPPTPEPIDVVTGTGDTSPLLGDHVQITGVVIGVDNQEDVSDFVDLQPEEAGIYVETPTADQDDNPQTSEGIFVGDLPAADRAAAHIGHTVTIAGTVDNQFGMKTIDAAGETPAFSGKASYANLPAPVTIDPSQAAAQTVASNGQRTYYETLQGMNVELAVGTANSGGTDKFGELFLDPGTATGLNTAGYNSPLGPPDLLDVTQDAGSSDVDPTNPDAEPASTTRVKADLHDQVSDLVGPLGFDFDNYDIVPQPGHMPKVKHRGVKKPPFAPKASNGTIRIANFNMDNLFGAGMTDDGHTYTQAEVDKKTAQLASAIKLMHRPDIIADEEVASEDAYDEVAAKLGDYTAYWMPSNDERHIAVGFLVKNGITVTGIQQLGKDATTTLTTCNDDTADNPQLFERPPLALSVQIKGLAFTLIGNHFASQSHPESCREAQADYVNGQVQTMEAAGTHVIVLGDMNAYQDSPSMTTDLIQGTTLQDLWFDAPAGNAYSFQFDGQLETLDHIFTDAYLTPLVKQIRYVHFDNDYVDGQASPGTPYGVSDHDPPVAVLKIPR